MPERWKTLLPYWARPEHPILQYELANLRLSGSRWKSIIQLLLLALLLGSGGYLYAGSTSTDTGAGNLADFIWRCLYFPSILVQSATVLSALAFGIGSVETDRSRQTWDSLRVTEIGAGLTLRTRWVAIFYRLRAPILALLMARLFLVLGMIVDMTAFGGGYLRVLGSALVDSGYGWWITLPMIVLLMTANLLLPLTIVGAASALGILISVAIKQRLFAITVQLVLSVTVVVGVAVGLFGVTSALQGHLIASDSLLFFLFLGYSGFVDGGLLFANLGSLGAVWKILQNGTFMSLGIVIILTLQALLIDGCLSLAIRLSERGE